MPVQVHIVDAIPRSSAQKIQRWKLAEQLAHAAQSSKDSHHQANVNVTEEVEQAWEQELGARPANLSDNFFSSGGSSIQAAALASNLSARTSAAVDSTLVYSNPEPDRLAAAVSERLHDVSSSVNCSSFASLRTSACIRACGAVKISFVILYICHGAV